jgi:hypothetical protein
MPASPTRIRMTGGASGSRKDDAALGSWASGHRCRALPGCAGLWRAAGRHQRASCKVAASGFCKRTVWACDLRKNEPASVRRGSWVKPLLAGAVYFIRNLLRMSRPTRKRRIVPRTGLKGGDVFELSERGINRQIEIPAKVEDI